TAKNEFFCFPLGSFLWFISQGLPYGVSFASLSCPLTNIYFLRALAANLFFSKYKNSAKK
ncbi:hypothetical protein AB9M75_12860, partial [Lactobacillus sp. AN1001]